MAFGKKLVKGFAYGNCVGFCLYVIGEIGKSILAVTTPLGLVGYAFGLAAAVSIAIAEDEKEDGKNQNQ